MSFLLKFALGMDWVSKKMGLLATLIGVCPIKTSYSVW